MKKQSKWVFVIDTESYAGNFEREMCAHLTGIVGECGVGDDMAPYYHKETGEKVSRFEGLLEQRNDEGCRRPCSIWPTPGWFNHGMGGEFRLGEDGKALKHHFQCVKEYNDKQIERTLAVKNSLLAGIQVSNWTVAACDRDVKRLQAEIDKAKELKKVSHYPSYQSVAIFFYDKPSQELIDLMKSRAATFAEAKRKSGRSWEKNFKLIISGFRLIEEKGQAVETAC